MGINIALFGGVQPAVAPRLLPPNMAQTALNAKLWKGDLRPWQAPLSIVTPSKVGTKQSIYRFGQDITNEAQYWFHWLTDVNVARGPVAGDTSERTYFTGAGGVPQVTDNSIALAGGTDYPMASYNLGLPAPAAAPTVGVSGVGSGTAVNKAYIYTYVSAWGEEGPPSQPSAIVSVQPGQTVNLSALSTAPVGAYNVATKRIYRTVSGNNTVDYRFVAEIPVATTTYADSAADSVVVLNEVCPSGGTGDGTDWLMPPADMAGLIVIENGIMAGFSGKTLCLSEAFVPSAWPVAYQKLAAYPIVGLGAISQGIVVCTKATPYVCQGVDPRSMTFDRIDAGKACVSKRSIATVGGTGVMYAAAAGMVLVDPGLPGGSKVVTESLMDRDDWQALVPSSINGYEYNGRYMGFYNTGSVTGGFILDPKSPTGALTFTDQYATAGYNDPIRDTLYLQIGADIKRWDGNPASALTYDWKSRIEVLPFAVIMSWAKVQAASYPVTFKLYVDGSLVQTQTVASQEPFRIAQTERGREFEVELTGTSRVKKVCLAQSMAELRTM